MVWIMNRELDQYIKDVLHLLETEKPTIQGCAVSCYLRGVRDGFDQAGFEHGHPET